MAEKVSETAKIFCCNPFKKDRHQSVKRSVRPVTDWMCDMFDTIVAGMKICDSCRKEMSKRKQVTDGTDDCLLPVASTTRPTNVDESFIALDVSLEYLNKSLRSLEESPVAKRKLQMKSYCDKKCSKIKKCLIEKVLTAASTDTEETVDNKSECEVICQLKEKFQEENISVSEKLQILTVLPKSWSCSQIQKEFNVSNRMARKAKALVKAKGILATPNPKPGKVLNESMIEKVIGFYNSDDVSRLMPGKKDFVSVKTGDSSRIHIQKRLVLGNLKEVYELFKNKNPTDKIGFSKFADLRPKHCVLAGGSGTHTVCICTTHQNVKLMLQVFKSKKITLNDGTDISNYNSSLAKLMCEEPGTACHLNECPSCPSVDNLKDELQLLLDNELVDNITYKQWVSVDRCNLVTFIKTADEFVESLCEQLLILKRHSFIARSQAEYYNYLKQNIGENEAVVCMDFAENYSFVLQDEAQSFHWNNDQATIFPIAVYYNDHNDIHYKSIVCISECLQHDTTAVHLFQKRLISYLKLEEIRDLKKIYYFSDGAAAHFKNRKNFSNLCHHVHDFGIEAEWHFYATAHGKGVCDGLGGTVKRLAGKASLQRPYEHQIMTPAQLFTWSEENIDSMQFFFFNEAQHNKEEKILADRFLSTKPIPGTQKFHSFIPVSDKVLLTKVFSRSEQSCTFSVLGAGVQQRLKLAEVKGYVTCENNNHWWLGVVVDKNETAQTVELMFLHPAGPSPSFTFKSDCPNKLTVPLSQILTLVQPRCPTGRSYYLSKEEMDAATMALENYCRQ